MSRRARASCIVELPNADGDVCILLAGQRGYPYLLLPGGSIEHAEVALCAAVRELAEEIGLHGPAAIHVFDHRSRFKDHRVFLMAADRDDFRPGDDVERLLLVRIPDLFEDSGLPCPLSRSTSAILERYVDWRESNLALVQALRGSCPGRST